MRTKRAESYPPEKAREPWPSVEVTKKARFSNAKTGAGVLKSASRADVSPNMPAPGASVGSGSRIPRPKWTKA